MNEIFNQLGLESGLLFQRDKLSYEELKFAELIVAECAETCSSLDGGENMFSRGILKHFGVEDND